MGVEVKSGGEGVIVADRGCNDGCCCNGRNSGWGSGWGAVGGALVDAQRDQNIIQSVVAALKTTSTTPA